MRLFFTLFNCLACLQLTKAEDDATTVVSEVHRLEGSSENSLFGWSVAVSENGEQICVGSPERDGSGAVTIFAYANDEWTQTGDITEEDSDEFGYALSAAGSSIAVGSPGTDTVYLYDDTSFDKIVTISAPDSAFGLDKFGASLVLCSDCSDDETLLFIGAPGHDINEGAVYCYGSSDTYASLKLSLDFTKSDDASTALRFGTSITAQGGYVAVGTPYDDENGVFAGAVFLYETASFTQLAKIVPSDATGSSWFGISVALLNGRLAVGAHRADNSAGAAYIFDQQDDDSWTETTKIGNGSFVGTADFNGYRVALTTQGMVAASSIFGDSSTVSDAGDVILYSHDTLEASYALIAGRPIADTWFGGALAIGGTDTLVVGAYDGDYAYVYNLSAIDDCVDSPLWYKKNDPSKDCDWVSELEDKSRCAVKGEDGLRAFEQCYVACGTCPSTCESEDSTTWFRSGDTERNCAWVATNYQPRCTRANDDGVYGFESAACPHACRICTYCDDDTTWTINNQPSKGCDWVATASQTRCSKRGVDFNLDIKYAFQSCPDACRVCPNYGDCSDDSGWVKNNEVDDSKNCEWVASAPLPDENGNGAARCVVKGTNSAGDTVLAFEACRVACSTC